MSRMHIRSRLSYEKSKALVGFLFIAPWLVGAIWFFIIPFIYSFVFSLNDTSVAGGIHMNFSGLKYYRQAFTGDPALIIRLRDTLSSVWYEILGVIVFSCFLALVLNGKYRGRLVVRGIFFLPVIIASGAIMRTFMSASNTNGMLSGAPEQALFQGVDIVAMLNRSGLPAFLSDLLIRIISSLFSLVWKSSVQILILMAGLQTVPKSAYEAAQMEGATAWEMFWKITFPMLTPILLLCSFYTVVDKSNDFTNSVVQQIGILSEKMDLSYASVVANIWFAITIVLILIVFLVFRKQMFYMEDMN